MADPASFAACTPPRETPHLTDLASILHVKLAYPLARVVQDSADMSLLCLNPLISPIPAEITNELF